MVIIGSGEPWPHGDDILMRRKNPHKQVTHAEDLGKPNK